MKMAVVLLFLVGSLFAQNSNGRLDTSLIKGFNSTGLKYSKAFNLSDWENLRVDVLAMDTNNSKTGFAGAAIKFYWFLETGHTSVNYLTGKWDTIWAIKDPLICDTFDITTAGNMVTTPRFRDNTTGAYKSPVKTIDTLSVRGYAVQSRNESPEWDELVRAGLKGLTGNQATTYVKAIVAMHRCGGMKVK